MTQPPDAPRWRRFVLLTLGVCAALLGGVGALNYTVDPQWTFPHATPWARYQEGFDERQQKTNALVFLSADYDGIVLGNSRVTFLDATDLPGHLYNFATSSMTPGEYLPYAELLATRAGHDLETIVLGESFVAAQEDAPPAPPATYIQRALVPGYRWRSLLSVDLLRHSVEAIGRTRRGDRHKAYVRTVRGGGVKAMVLPRPAADLKRSIAGNLAIYRRTAYGRFVYQPQGAHYAALRARFPQATLRVYTTPVSAHMLRLLVQMGLLDAYLQWLNDLVTAVGPVWHFMTFNSVTEDDAHFADAHHSTPEVGVWIADRLFGRRGSTAPADFGVLLRPQTLQAQLATLRASLSAGAAAP